MYIYIDILIITNIYANFFLLKATAKMTHSNLRNGKCVLGALVGSLFSLIILLPELSAFCLLLLRVASAVLMVMVSFKKKSIYDLYITGLFFFFVCFIFAGIQYAVAIMINSSEIIWHNGVFYINISLLTLVISTIIAYAVLSLIRRILDNKNCADGSYSVTIINNKQKLTIKAVADTCNNLTDSFSGKPIIICSKKCIQSFLDKKVLTAAMNFTSDSACSELFALKGWRFIPFSTIDSSGIVPAFLPSDIYLCNNETKSVKYIEAYIGIVEKDIDYAIFNPKLL